MIILQVWVGGCGVWGVWGEWGGGGVLDHTALNIKGYLNEIDAELFGLAR